MTVKELRAVLKGFPPDMRVGVTHSLDDIKVVRPLDKVEMLVVYSVVSAHTIVEKKRVAASI